MKLLPSLFLPFLMAPAFGQTDRIDLTFDAAGHARAKIGDLVLSADEATLGRETGELAMRGHVHATLPAREDHSVVRYGADVLITDQPIGLTADRLTVKKGLLKAAGNIVVVPVDQKFPKVQLRGDELSMDLKIADATLRGSVRPINIPEPVPSLQRRYQRVFPPDIVK